jgi:hypothetical protein
VVFANETVVYANETSVFANETASIVNKTTKFASKVSKPTLFYLQFDITPLINMGSDSSMCLFTLTYKYIYRLITCFGVEDHKRTTLLLVTAQGGFLVF